MQIGAGFFVFFFEGNMLVVLSKAIAFVLIILIGYICKRRGVFAPTDYQLVSKIVLNITLPCAVISSFAHFQASPQCSSC